MPKYEALLAWFTPTLEFIWGFQLLLKLSYANLFHDQAFLDNKLVLI